MPVELYSLPVLALVDSTSFGTLLIPIWLMLAPGRLRARRVLAFLGVVGGYYFVLGAVLLAGATQVADALGGFLDSPAGTWAQLGLGVALFLLSFRIGRADREEAKEKAAAKAEGRPAVVEPRKPGRVTRWRARAMGAEGAGSLAALLGLALGAALIETASMLPYLSAIGILTASGLSLAQGVGLLAGYCVIMVLPALVLLALRLVAARYVQRPLERLEAWMSRSAGEMTSWIVGIIGALLALDALGRAGIPGISG